MADPLGYTSRTERKAGYRNIVHFVRLIGLAEWTGSVIQQIMYLDSVDKDFWGGNSAPVRTPWVAALRAGHYFRFVNRGGLA